MTQCAERHLWKQFQKQHTQVPFEINVQRHSSKKAFFALSSWNSVEIAPHLGLCSNSCVIWRYPAAEVTSAFKIASAKNTSEIDSQTKYHFFQHFFGEWVVIWGDSKYKLKSLTETSKILINSKTRNLRNQNTYQRNDLFYSFENVPSTIYSNCLLNQEKWKIILANKIIQQLSKGRKIIGKKIKSISQLTLLYKFKKSNLTATEKTNSNNVEEDIHLMGFYEKRKKQLINWINRGEAALHNNCANEILVNQLIKFN